MLRHSSLSLRHRSLWARALACALLLLAAVAQAQSVRWDPASGTLARDQVSQLALVFEDAEPKDQPAPPKVDGLTFGTPGRSEQSSFNLSLGSQPVRRRTIIYTFPVRPTRADGEVRVPAFAVETDAGRLTVPAAGFRIAAATVGEGVPLDEVATARFDPPATPVWAGQVFPLTFRLEVDRRYATNSILGGPLEWSPAPLVAEDWSKPAGAETTINGKPRLLVSMETRAVAPAVTSATLVPIPAATQVINLPTGTANPFSLFGQATFEQKTLTTAPARLAVNPLPSPAPSDFIGAVGRFTLTSKVVPENASVGEPVTWTLTLEGSGNWPAIDALRPRPLSRDFRVVNPRAQKTLKPDTLFDGSLVEDLVLIPQKPGRTTLGPYTLTVFNPDTGAYETLRTDPVQIEISAPAATVDPLRVPAAPASSTDSSSPPPPSDPAAPPPEAPAPVAQLPADPLPPGLLTPAPRSDWPRALYLTPLALVLPAALWLFLAARHARRHDPLRARRAAHAELRQILARLETSTTRGTPSPASASDLLAWQHATRVLFDLPSLTPSAHDIPDAIWSALWIETERALYRPATSLSRDWFAQAWQAHARATLPPRSPFAAFRPAHLFPRVALWLVVFLSAAGASSSRADSPDAAQLYARGEFPAAESALRPALEAAPLDAAHRHNLALALAQQGKWDEAAAHAYAAALQQPGAPALGRLFAATAPKAAYRIQLPPTPARLLAVPGWQWLALGAALGLLALAPAAYLLALYLPAARRRTPILAGHCAVVLAVTGLVAALLALRAHGPAAHRDAALVWRAATLRAIPTDLGDQKVTAELPPGTLARIDKDFLGWRRLVLPDGNTGWVRSEALVPLWR